VLRRFGRHHRGREHVSRRGPLGVHRFVAPSARSASAHWITAHSLRDQIDDALKKLDELEKREEALAQQQRNGQQTADNGYCNRSGQGALGTVARDAQYRAHGLNGLGSVNLGVASISMVSKKVLHHGR